MAKPGLVGIFGRFSKQFWVVNTFELFERGSYYGMLAIFAYHVVYNIGFDDAVAGSVLGMLMPLLYFMPLISATLAEKYGYKPTFIISFIIMIIGYGSLYTSNNLATLIASTLTLGVGAGAFKPMVSATVAHVTSERDRNYGFSIYYWMINLGAFLFPLIIGGYVEGVLGDPSLYAIAFLISTVFITVNLIICLIWFREPAPLKKDLKVTKAFKNLALVVKDRRFVSLLTVYSGFFMMFQMAQLFMPVYVVDFGIKPDWFAIPWIHVVNPGTIILFGPMLSIMVDKISDRFSSIQLMITGITIFIIGVLMIAFVKTFIICFLGIIVFSIGEFLTHPQFISFVSKIAPKDKVAMYMGYAFIPIGVGATLGSIFSGVAYGIFAAEMHQPSFYFGLVTVSGFLTMAGLLFFNRHYSISATTTSIDREEKVDVGVLAAPNGGPRMMDRVFNSRLTPFIAIAMIPVVLVATYGMGEDPFYRDVDGDGEKDKWVLTADGIGPISGSSTENSDSQEFVNISMENVVNVTFTLTWTDEPDPGLGLFRQNQPDEFSLKVETPDGLVAEEGPVSNAHGSEGSITVTITRDGNIKNRTKTDAMGDYAVTITMGNAGDSVPPLGVGPSVQDTGNSWSLEVEYEYYEKVIVIKEEKG